MSSNPQKFLTEKEVDELTGIRRGTCGKPKYQRQCEHLRKKGVPFWDDVRGRPIIAVATIEGRSVESPKKTWQPKLANA